MSLLKKLKLVKHITIELDIQKNDFVRILKSNVDDRSTGFMSNTVDIFSSSKNEFKGHVGFEHFKIKKRKRFFDTNINLAVAKGSYRQNNETLIIETEINGFSRLMIPFYIFAIFIYAAFIISFMFAKNVEGNIAGMFVPFMLLHASLMLGIPYLMMRRSTKRLAYELEREFFYLANKKKESKVINE